ncbi:rhomboid family intramembrane serine protease [Rhodobacteraceae bacterium CCMM004]|nr:rhomboid family intramembrane serine protease [Rhodobacteraceae bacterium CCMM004]
MFPIRDHNPSRETPFVTYALIAVNVVVFLATWPLMADERALIAFYHDWAMTPAILDPVTLITSQFLHGGLLHLAGNMLFLFIFGDNLEDEMGRLPFLAFYLASGVAAALAQALADPASTVPMVGASGAIAGVMGGYLLLFPKARVDVLIIIVVFFKVLPIPAWIVLGLWFALQVFSGASTPIDGGGVAYWAHAGGFAAGLGLSLPLFLHLGGPAFWQRTHGHPPHPEASYRVRPTSIPRAGRRR